MHQIRPTEDPPIYDLRIMNHALRSRSRLIFGGARYRAEVGAAIHSGDVFCSSDVATRLENPPCKASLNAELRILEEAGLLERQPRSGRTVILKAIDTPYWDACRSLTSADDALRHTENSRVMR